MSYSNIEVQPSALREVAVQIRKCRTDTEANLNEAINKMENLTSNGLRSQAGEAIKERLNVLRARYFQNYQDVMCEYEQYLERTASEYEVADNRRKAEINSMMNTSKSNDPENALQ